MLRVQRALKPEFPYKVIHLKIYPLNAIILIILVSSRKLIARPVLRLVSSHRRANNRSLQNLHHYHRINTMVNMITIMNIIISEICKSYFFTSLCAFLRILVCHLSIFTRGLVRGPDLLAPRQNFGCAFTFGSKCQPRVSGTNLYFANEKGRSCVSSVEGIILKILDPG